MTFAEKKHKQFRDVCKYGTAILKEAEAVKIRINIMSDFMYKDLQRISRMLKFDISKYKNIEELTENLMEYVKNFPMDELTYSEQNELMSIYMRLLNTYNDVNEALEQHERLLTDHKIALVMLRCIKDENFIEDDD